MIKKVPGPATIIILLLFLACSTHQPAATPEEALEGFLKNIDRGNIAGARKYISTASIEIFDRLSETISEKKPARPVRKFEYKKVEQKDIIAHITIINIIGEKKTEQDFVVIKEEDGWKLALDKTLSLKRENRQLVLPQHNE